MAPRRILFISGSVGLGHVTRDLAMARALRQTLSGADIRWLAAAPSVRSRGGVHAAPGVRRCHTWEAWRST